VRHLRSIPELGVDGIVRILALTDHMVEVNRRPVPKVPALVGRTVVSLFFEDSTRTRISFETAAKRLSADTMTFSSMPAMVRINTRRRRCSTATRFARPSAALISLV